MRKYILDFLQDNIIALKLKPADIFILSYMIDFFGSGYAKMEFLDGKRHFYLTYKKILEDLSFLQIKERRLRYILDRLQSKQVISKKTIKNTEMYIYINLELLCEPISQETLDTIFPPVDSTPITLSTLENSSLHNDPIIQSACETDFSQSSTDLSSADFATNDKETSSKHPYSTQISIDTSSRSATNSSTAQNSSPSYQSTNTPPKNTRQPSPKNHKNHINQLSSNTAIQLEMPLTIKYFASSRDAPIIAAPT